MKKILTPKSSPSQTVALRAKLRRLILEHHDDIAAFKAVRVEVHEAWELSGGRVKLRVELELKDGSYRTFTRVVPFALPPAMKSTYRDWTIVTKPTWYGYGYQLLDETGAAAGESETDLIEAKHVEQNARRAIDRQIAERAKTKPAARPLSQAPAARTIEAELLPAPAPSPAASDFPVHPRATSEQLIVVEKEPSAVIEGARNNAGVAGLPVPAIIAREDRKTAKRFLEFFTVTIRNPNTRAAYARACVYFLDWCHQRGLTLHTIEPMHVAAYIEKLTKEREPQTVKQHLAAIRMLFDWLVIGQSVPFNPAASVKGPSYSYKKGKTPILDEGGMKQLLDGIDTSTVVGLRDRALIALMFYSFGRVTAAIAMDVKDYYPRGKRYFVGLREKGGKYHEVPVHHKAEEYLDAYIQAAGLSGQKDTPLFRSSKGKKPDALSENRMSRVDAWKMIKRRGRLAGIREEISPHSFRGTGITLYLESGGTLEDAQNIANHESARTTKLYDRTGDQISLDEIERIPAL